ncbi:aldehyde dehydrogenase (plasmid) [Neorhizobium sp. SOG26]|uniref:aldehyde dehydrogenase family protein n=1 Tax=Neorhizobium sp. SOG26 TaxID=2060726 RepID=UPI000E588F18|nr:aldehyde dehydrogenase family protein [Neorhizobium sp. SOG26]AXV18083.1 aldehyde dehydrogenase [Neorhizobium sp. SOG26]
MMDHGHFSLVDGVWLQGINGCYVSLNPADRSPVGEVHGPDAAVAEQAVAAAVRGFRKGQWARSPRTRAAALNAMADAVAAIANDLIDLLVRENGKLRAEATGEVMASISELRYYAGLSRDIFGRTFSGQPGQLSLIDKEPAGVCAVITPWNAPLTLLVRSLGPALAAGCTVIVKPHRATTVVSNLFMRAITSVPNLPTGVLQSLNDPGDWVGARLVNHEHIRVISFTGSTATGAKIAGSAASRFKKLSLELGGKAPAVVLEDADLDRAAREIAKGITVLSGQMCVCVSRVLVDRHIAEAFRDKLIGELSAVRPGPGHLPSSTMGAMFDDGAVERHMTNQQTARAHPDMEVLLAGEDLRDETGGCFVTPALFSSRTTDHPLIQNELFTPMASFETFDNPEEAVALANVPDFGLAASVHSTDINRARWVASRIDSGTVWINCHNRLFVEVETGGYKSSGIGRLHGVEALLDFQETKHVYLENDYEL